MIPLHYPYLVANTFGLLPLCFILHIAEAQRRAAVICGCILAIYSPPVAYLYDGAYWAPERLFPGRWGIEDAIFCFHAGAVSWVCAIWPWRRTVQIRTTLSAGRLVALSIAAAALLICLLASGFTVLQAFLSVQTASTAILLVLNRSYARLVPAGVIGFMLYYFSLLQLWILTMPGFMAMWSGRDLGGGKLLGVPVEEYLWVLSFCTAFPITMAYCMGLEFVPPKASGATAR